MNFAPYQNRESLNAPASQVSNVRYTNAGEQALARADGLMGATIAEGFTKLKDTVEQGKALEASNEYNQRMSQGTAELMQLKEQEALDITDQYDQLRKKTMDDIQKKYGNYLRYGAAAQAFQEYTMRDDATRRANMMKYQHAQTEAYRTTQTNNALAVCAQQAADSGYTDEGIDGAIERANPIIGFQFANYGDEKIKEQQRLAAGKFVGDALRFAINTNDFQRTQDLVKRYGKFMPPEQRSAAMAIANKRQKEAEALSQNQIMLNDLGWNASYDDVAGWVRRNFSPPKSGTPLTKEAFFDAVSGQESGGNYEAENGRTGAFGKYQIMPENWPSWAKEAGLSSDAPMTAENQEKVAKHKLGQYYDELGAEGALVAWYAGYRNGKRWVDGEPDAIGEGGHYSWDAPQGNGDEPSIREYVQQALARVPAGDSAVDALALEEKTAEAWKFYRERQGLRDTESKQRISSGVDRMDIMKNQGITDPAAYDEAMNEYIYFPDGTIDEHAAARLGKFGAELRRAAEKEARAKAEGGGKKNNDPFAALTIERMLEEGRSPEEVLQFINDGDFADAKSLINMVVKDWGKGKGVFAQEWEAIKQSVREELRFMDDSAFELRWAMAKHYAWDRLQDWQTEHKGQEVTLTQRKNWLIEGLTEQEYPVKRATYLSGYDTKEMTPAEMYDRGVTSFGYNDKANSQTVTLTDGGTFNITTEQYQRILNGEPARWVVFNGEQPSRGVYNPDE